MRPSQTQRPDENGLTLLEVLISAALTAGILLVMLRADHSAQDAIVQGEKRMRSFRSLSDVVRRVELLLRTSSLDLAPIRVYDPSFATDGIDNDFDLIADEAGEELDVDLRDGMSASGIWFRRVLGPDLTFVPPRLVYEPPARLAFVLDPGETDDDVDNDGDGWIDEGSLTLQLGEEEIPLASDITRFRMTRAGSVLHMTIGKGVREAGKRPPTEVVIDRSFHLRNR